MQITKLSFLSTQAVGDNVFAVEEFLDIPIDQIFGTHRAREKALFNFINSDAVEKVSRDTWRIVKDITLDAANVKMRKGDFFRVRLDEEGDDSPIHFGLDATGVFVLSRAVFASLQTYRVLEPGVQESIRMQFTFGGHPVTDAKLTSKFASMDLIPVDAMAGIYELKIYTAMAPSDDILTIEVTGTSLNNYVYEAPVRITVREPVLTVVPIDVEMNQKQTKSVSWQLLMEGAPAPISTPIQALPDPLIPTVLAFTLVDATNAIYEMRAVAGDTPGVSPVTATYDFGRGYVATTDINVTIATAPGVFITQDTLVLEANQTQLIRFYAKWAKDGSPVTNAQFSTTDIRGTSLQTVEQTLVVIDPAQGLYGYRVTTNHKGGPISVRTNITSDGTPYPVFFNLTAKSTPVTATAINTLPAADTAYLEFRVQQDRLGGSTPLAGAVARQFTVTGPSVVGVQGAVEAVGQGVYRLKVVTNDRGGSVNVSAILTIDGEDYPVAFSTSADKLGDAIVAATGPALTGETTQSVPFEVTFEGKPYDLGTPSVSLSGISLISFGALRRIGVGKYEIQDVNVNGKGGVLGIVVNGKVQGFAQQMEASVAVMPVSSVVASNVTHYRPTTQGPLQFTALRDNTVLALAFSNATLSGTGFSSYDPTVQVVDASKGRYQVKNVVASAPTSSAPIGISIPYKLRAYSYTLVFNTYTEAMPVLTVDTKGVVPEGSKKADYLLYFQVDGVSADLEASNIQGSGPAFVSIDSPNLEQVSPGVWAIKGLLPGPDRGQIVISGTVSIDSIQYSFSTQIRSKDAAPTLDLVKLADLEPEKQQTVYFTLSKKGLPVGDAVLANGSVTGAGIEGFDGFALHDAATGTYRFNVVTNGKGGAVDVDVDITIDGDVYPMHLVTAVKPGKVWGLTSGSTPSPATANQTILFGITNDGIPLASPYLRALDLSGTAVRQANKDIVVLGSTIYSTTGIKTGSPAGDVKLSIQASSNNINWHDLDTTWQLPQASTPVVSIGPMISAVATSTLTVQVTRNGQPLFAPVFSNLVVTGAAVDVATLDWVKLNANGTYGTTIKTNALGGPISIAFDVEDDGVVYSLTGTGQADILRPWTATLKSGAPVPESLSNIDFQSMYGGAPAAMTEVKLRLVGSCVVSPIGEISAVYQDGVNQIYRMPNVMVNNDGGPVTLEISGKVNDQTVTTVLQMNVVKLPAMQITNTTPQLAFRQTSDWTFTVNRGAANPSIFENKDVSNLRVVGNALAGYTPTIVPLGAGQYKVSVETNSLGGPVSMSFDVTIAGQTNSLSVQTTAAVEPPVTANGLNTLETNTTATNLDFQLMRGPVPCADPFVVKKVVITGRSVTAYPQTVLNVDVAAGKYRMQVNTSAYNDPADVEIEATVRGEPVTLKFTVQVKQGVLPTVTLGSDNFIYNLMSSGTLVFRQGATAISGVTVDSIVGPLDQWSVNGSTLNGVPTSKGVSALTVNFLWKGALYSGQISINPINSVIVPPIGDTKLKAYVPNKVNFPLLKDDGSAYPASTTFTVAAAPFTATQLVQEPDGTYSMQLTYAGELATTNVIITATDSGNVTKHIVAYSVWLALEARFSGTTLLDSTQVSNKAQFDVYEVNQGGVKDVFSGVDLDSLDVDATNPNDLVGYSTFEVSSATRYRGTFFVSTKPSDLVDLTFQFYWKSPLNRVYTIKGKFRVQKPIVADWQAVSLDGGVPGTLKVILKSGNSPITDAVESGTVITRANVTKPLYAIDAANGLYGIDVVPNGNTSTLGVTLSIKQQVNNLLSTLDAHTYPVTPGAYAAVPMLTLKRQIESQSMDMQFTQGGTPLSGVVINSVSYTGGIASIGTATASGTTYRFPTVVTLDGTMPHLTLNITIAGVGMVLEVDYPIDPPVTPMISLNQSLVWVKGQMQSVTYALKIGSTVYARTDQYSDAPYTVAETKVTDGYTGLSLNNAKVYLPGSTSRALVADFTPLTAGAQTWKVDVTYNGVVYHTETPITVLDAVMLVLDGTYTFVVGRPTVVNFHLVPPVGVTLDPAAIPTLTTPLFPITKAITSLGNGNYTMEVTPAAETTGNQTVGTLVSNGTTYQVGASTSPQARYNLAFAPNNVATGISETAGGVVKPKANLLFNVETNAVTSLTINGSATDAVVSNLRVTSDVAGVVAGAPSFETFNTTYSYTKVATNVVDFATLTWKVDVKMNKTGFEYKDLERKSIVHDAVIVEAIPGTSLLNGVKGDVQFKLKWATSGNPVKNAIFGAAHAVTGGVADATLKVIDANQGLYAVSVMPNTGVTTVSLTPGWKFPLGEINYTGTVLSVPVTAAVTITQPMYGSVAGAGMSGVYDQAMTIRVHPSLGMTPDGKVMSVTPAGFLASVGPFPVSPADNIFRVPCRSKVMSGTVAASYAVDITFELNGVSSTISSTYAVIGNAVEIQTLSSLTTAGGELTVTPTVGATLGSTIVTGWDIIGADGTKVSGISADNTYAVDGKIRISVPVLPALQHARVVIRFANGLNVVGGDLNVADTYGTTITGEV